MKALVVHQLRESRHRLVRLLEYSPGAIRVQGTDSITNILKPGKSFWDFNYVFISEDFGEKELGAILEKIRSNPDGIDTIFILLSSRSTSDSESVADSMMLGFHGFLCEPLTADRIQQVLQLSTAVKRQGSQPRMRAATGLYLADMLTESHDSNGKPINLWERVQKSCDAYKQVTGESITTAIVNSFQKTPSGRRTQVYAGASKRVRDLFRSTFAKRLKEYKD